MPPLVNAPSAHGIVHELGDPLHGLALDQVGGAGGDRQVHVVGGGEGLGQHPHLEAGGAHVPEVERARRRVRLVEDPGGVAQHLGRVVRGLRERGAEALQHVGLDVGLGGAGALEGLPRVGDQAAERVQHGRRARRAPSTRASGRGACLPPPLNRTQARRTRSSRGARNSQPLKGGSAASSGARVAAQQLAQGDPLLGPREGVAAAEVAAEAEGGERAGARGGGRTRPGRSKRAASRLAEAITAATGASAGSSVPSELERGGGAPALRADGGDPAHPLVDRRRQQLVEIGAPPPPGRPDA